MVIVKKAKPHSSSWLPAACGAVTEITSCLYQQSKSCESKVKLRHANNRCKRVLETAKLACANKTKESSFSQKLGSCNFWRVANVNC